MTLQKRIAMNRVVLAVSSLLCAVITQASVATGPPFNTTWLTSRTKSNLTVSKDNVLTWGLESTDGIQSIAPLTKTTAEVILTNLKKPVSLKTVGNEFTFKVKWLSTGEAPSNHVDSVLDPYID